MNALRFNQPVTTPDGEGVAIGISGDGKKVLASAKINYPEAEKKEHLNPYYIVNRWYKLEEIATSALNRDIIASA